MGGGFGTLDDLLIGVNNKDAHNDNIHNHSNSHDDALKKRGGP